MVFKFSNNFTLDEVKDKRKIKKSKTFSNKVVFVNGFSASGKTMLAPIISSMQNVETIISLDFGLILFKKFEKCSFTNMCCKIYKN